MRPLNPGRQQHRYRLGPLYQENRQSAQTEKRSSSHGAIIDWADGRFSFDIALMVVPRGREMSGLRRRTRILFNPRLLVIFSASILFGRRRAQGRPKFAINLGMERIGVHFRFCRRRGLQSVDRKLQPRESFPITGSTSSGKVRSDILIPSGHQLDAAPERRLLSRAAVTPVAYG
jgi:hypothetical protein